MTEDRKPGFYWVRERHIRGLGPWTIAEFDSGGWWVIGRDWGQDEAEFADIGPIITMPEGLPS